MIKVKGIECFFKAAMSSSCDDGDTMTREGDPGDDFSQKSSSNVCSHSRSRFKCSMFSGVISHTL